MTRRMLSMEKKRGKANFKILLKKQTMTHVSWKTGSALKIISNKIKQNFQAIPGKRLWQLCLL